MFCADQPELRMDLYNASSSTTSYGYAESGGPLEMSVAQTRHQVEALPQMIRNSFKFKDFLPLPYDGENSWSQNGWPVLTSTQLSAEDMSVVQASTWSPGNSTWGPGNAFIFTSTNEGDVGIFSSHRMRTPKARWCKIRAALKMGSIMRDVAAKRMWQSLCY